MATRQLPSHLGGVAVRPGQAWAVVTLGRVEGRRLVRHPALIIPVVLAIAQTAPFLLFGHVNQEDDVGWLVQVSAWLISFAALLAANLQASKSRRDGSEEMFRAAPLPPARRTLALAIAAAWVMALLSLLLLAGDISIRAAGRGPNSDSGQALFPLFDLVQGPLVAGLLVLIGIAVARWFPWTFAGPAAVVGLFVLSTLIGDVSGDPTWLRLTPFDARFLDDGAALAATHAVYLVGLSAVVLGVALLRSEGNRGIRMWLAGGLGVAGASGVLQLVS